MKKYSLILLPLIFSCSVNLKGTYNIGQKSLVYTDTSRQRLLVTELWYPTYEDDSKNEKVEMGNKLFQPITTIPKAKMAKGSFPMLLVSHGAGGNRFSLTWFVERMVKEGYLIASIDHQGTSSSAKIPRDFLMWWERAIDMQYLLTQLLAEEEIGKTIDQSSIAGVGFSLGGYTNIALAGGYVDRLAGLGAELPPEFPHTTELINFESDSLILASYHHYKDKVKDDRFSAFFVMAPAIGFGFHSKSQTAEITAPIFIVAGQGDANCPISENALRYHELIPTSQLHLLDENTGHYVFLNEPTEFGKQIAPAICIDHAKVDRGEVHKKVFELAKDFFAKSLPNPTPDQ